MPLLALEKFHTHISQEYFYAFGQKCSTNDFIDAHVWQFSPHVRVAQSNTTTSKFIAQQIRVSTLNNQLSKQLLKDTLSIYEAIATSRISWNGQIIALDDICTKTPYGTCIGYSPLAYWNDDFDRIERDIDPIVTINKNMHKEEKETRLSLHPYSTMGNVKLDRQGHLVSADSLIITFILQNTSSTLKIWYQLYQHAIQELEVTERQLDVVSCSLQYKLRILPSPSTHTLVTLIAVLGLFILLKRQFGKSELIKSKSGLALATIFLSATCYTLTMGLFHILHMELLVIPWFLPLLVCTTANLEHALLLTSTVVTATREKEMSVKERMATGLQQVGISMTCTLFGELIVLGTGSAIKANHVRSFCLFASLALVVAYVLNLTFFMAMLSIDIKRTELTDLGNEGLKREKFTSHDSQHNSNHNQGNKSKRAINALFLCLILISLVAFPSNNFTTSQKVYIDKSKYNQLASISDQFWDLINPSHNTEWLVIQPPYAVILSSETAVAEKNLQSLISYYNKKLSTIITPLATENDGKFDVLLDTFQPYLLLFFSINISSILLFFVLICIMSWMTPTLREKFLLPFARILYVRTFTFLLRIISKTTPFSVDSIIRRVENEYYNEEGVHIGAISLQSEYNKSQTQYHVRNVKIHTLAGCHIADIRQLSSESSKTVSTGQDGKIVLWENDGRCIARLDRLRRLGGGCNGWVAEKNASGIQKDFNKKSDIKCLPRARCVQISQDGKWVIAGFENGMVRVWNATTVHLVREISIVKPERTATKDKHGDRVIHLAFLDEQYAKETDVKKDNNILKLSKQQHFILSVHKDGTLREWNLKTGEMSNCIKSNHSQQITAIHILSDNQRARQFILTASEDGTVKCWERRHMRSDATSNCKYTISDGQKSSSSMTSVAAQQMRNGEGIVVTGSVDGAVKVWNLDSGNAICTLSKGGDDMKEVSDHSDAISQVVVTPISNPEFENNVCPSCHTVLNSGFFVASCSLDQTVHVWRLDRLSTLNKDIGCPGCRKDYHSRSMRFPAAAPISALRSQQRKMYYNSLSAANSGDEAVSTEELLLTLNPLFLGKLHSFAGHGLVLCKNMVLAGVRRHTAPGTSMNLVSSANSLPSQQQNKDGDGKWEIWFTSLQYYEPPSSTEDTASLIPVINYDPERDENYYREQMEENSSIDQLQQPSSVWDWVLLHAFGVKKVGKVNNHAIASGTQLRKISSELYSNDLNDEEEEEDFDNSSQEDEEEVKFGKEDAEDDEAYDFLPFSSIQHVVPTNNGYGLACDFGNFIKIISFDDE